MSQTNLRAVGDRIEQLLDELRSFGLPRAWDCAQEAVGLVAQFHGAALDRVLEIVSESSDQAVLHRLIDDPVIASLLVLHGLHPLDLGGRVDKALEDIRPYVHSHGGEVELIDVDAEANVVKLRMLGSCDGCPSSSVTLKLAVERAIQGAAPEVTRIEVDGVDLADVADVTEAEEEPASAGTPIELGRKPVGAGVAGSPV